MQQMSVIWVRFSSESPKVRVPWLYTIPDQIGWQSNHALLNSIAMKKLTKRQPWKNCKMQLQIWLMVERHHHLRPTKNKAIVIRRRVSNFLKKINWTKWCKVCSKKRRMMQIMTAMVYSNQSLIHKKIRNRKKWSRLKLQMPFTFRIVLCGVRLQRVLPSHSHTGQLSSLDSKCKTRYAWIQSISATFPKSMIKHSGKTSA